MATVKFTRHLIRFFPQLEGAASAEAEGETVAQIITDLNLRFPGLAEYIVDERGRLRKHVNIFLNEALIVDRDTLSDPVQSGDKLYIFQALSGG